MSEIPFTPEMERYTDELNLLSLHLEDTTYENEIIEPTAEVPTPILAIELEEEDEGDGTGQIVAYYMYVTSDEDDEEDGEESGGDGEDDIFDHTAYLQAIVNLPIGDIDDEDMLDIFLLCSAVNHQLPLGCLFVTAEKQLAYRNVFAVDKSIGLTREVFLETLFVIHYIVSQTMRAVVPLLAGEVEFDEAIELFMMPAS